MKAKKKSPAEKYAKMEKIHEKAEMKMEKKDKKGKKACK
jgi:hypothetical protein